MASCFQYVFSKQHYFVECDCLDTKPFLPLH
uniref:Uncharacterized protein n=1 Tax=Rhizophora mucronata TaxID=61149 RepID=A0A2P2PRQ5_RHIMU